MTLFVFIAALIAFATALVIAIPLVRGRDAEGKSAKPDRFAALIMVGLIPMAAGFIYLLIGTPAALDPVVREADPVDPSAAIAALPPAERMAMIENMVSGLAARLETEPDDLAGWRMLARSNGVLGRHQQAAAAWRKAAALSDGEVEDLRGVALALAEVDRAANKVAIKQVYQTILEKDADDPLALYFLGQYAADEGDTLRAVELWSRLREQVPDDVAFAKELDSLIADAAN